MLIPRSSRIRPERRGVILLVVLALLTLFAVVGITFVLVANSQETSARIARESVSQTQPDFDGELALTMYLSQLVYDAPDDASGIQSSIRGHSLARLMYAYNNNIDPNTLLPLTANDKAFSGTGRLHNSYFNNPSYPKVTVESSMADDAYMVNYQYFPNAGDGIGPRDPERPGFRPAIGGQVTSLGIQQATWMGGANIPYTYPDHQNFSLAYQDATTGQILVPSFHREYLFGRLDDLPPNPAAGTTGNPNWTNNQGKYLTARPRPIDVDPNGTGGFPYPVDRGGDVKNADWAPGGMDSIWTDPGFPVMTNADGRKYKILVAPLVMELDSRLNLNVAGNLVGNPLWPTPNGVKPTTNVGSNSNHASNQGWGPWEVNPFYVLNADAGLPAGQPREWMNLLYGSWPNGAPQAGQPPTGRAHVTGRYGTVLVPGDPLTGGGIPPRGWAPADYNGLDESLGTNVGSNSGYLLPGIGTNSPYATFPLFPGIRYGTGTFPPGNPWPTEDLTHPRYYNPMRSTPFPLSSASVTGADGRILPTHAMHQLLRYGGSGSDYVTSDLLRLLPNNLNGPGLDGKAPTRRNLVTTLSFDLDRPGATPYIWDPTNAGTPTASFPYQMGTLTNPPYPVGGPISFPQLGQFGTAPTPSEFDQATWRSLLSALGRINLNRQLTPFPPLGANGVIPPAAQSFQALADRQQFAMDIFTVLVQVTTGYPSPALACNAAYTLPPSNGQSLQYQALRYLAQLSANIVDYIDTDDQSTPFLWYTPTQPMAGQQAPIPEWVFGTENPRLLINEAYAQLDNGTNPAPAPVTPGSNVYGSTAQLNVNIWLELFNPLQPDPVSTTTQDTTALLQSTAAPNSPSTNLYQILLVNPAANAAATGMTPPGPLQLPGNTAGNPNYLVANPMPGTYIYSTVNNFTSNSTITNSVPPLTPAGPGAPVIANVPAGATGPSPVSNPIPPPQGFYVIGPSNNSFLGNGPMAGNAGQNYQTNPSTAPYTLPYTLQSTQMSYTLPITDATTSATMPAPIVLLQRLACPLLPPNNTPPAAGQPYSATNLPYNPYITVDSFYFQNGWINDSRYYNTTMPLTPTPMAQRTSFGRMQPFAGQQALTRVQTVTPPPANQPINTFFSHNTPSKVTTSTTTPPLGFDWNTHLDRNLISPIELLFVHGGRPMDLTQQFVDNSDTLNQARYAPWLDQQSRLHRFLEVAETRPITAGVAPWGRIPGKVNINGVWPSYLGATPSQGVQSDIWNALCDAQPGNVFTQADVNKVFQVMFGQRSTNVGYFSKSSTNPILGNSWNMPGPTDLQLVTAANAFFGGPLQNLGYSGVNNNGTNSTGWNLDRPFWGHGTGFASTPTDPMAQTLPLNTTFATTPPGAQQPATVALYRGLDNSLLRPLAPGTAAGARTFGVPVTNTVATHPYQKMELLNKIYGSVTTRSNVFAVYLTVGFFTVTNDQTTPVQLGAEVGRAENRQVRHRMFAIVDRSNLTNFTTMSTGPITPVIGNNATALPPSPPQAAVPQLQNIPVIANSTNPNTGRKWQLQQGMYLTFDPNTNNEETVIVQPGAQAGTWTAAFALSHGTNQIASIVENGTTATAVTTAPHTITVGQQVTIAGSSVPGYNLTATVTAVTSTTFNFTAQPGLAPGGGGSVVYQVTVINRGNPGPWIRYDPRQDTRVVPYFAIID
jgi:hypothetical protein